MERYNEYKDSGVQWLGEIPSHWEVCKVKHHYKMITGFTPSTGKSEYYSNNSDNTWVTIADMKTKFISESSSHISDLYIKNFKPTIVPKGSLLYSFKLSVGQVAFADKDLYTNEAISSFENNENVCLGFLFYSASLCIIKNANTNIYGAFILNQELIKNATIVYPPFAEQKAIANYLDTATAKIDEAIAQQQKMIDLLNERKQIIINNAVTKGLNPDAPMKDSGVDWIGKIPEHWMTRRMRYLCKIKTGDKDTINRVDEGKYPFYVRSPKVERINSYTFDGEAVLMAGDGVGAGKVFHYVNGKFGCHQRVYIFHDIKNINGEYLYFYMKSLFKHTIEQLSAKSTVDSVRLNMIQDFIVAIPTNEEQTSILSYLHKQIEKFDVAIANATKQISLLQERKQIIINDVVTGKVKVS